MSDNSTLPATGDVIATDDIAGVKYQRVKIAVGADGSADDMDSTHPVYVAQNGTWTVQPGNTANTTAWKVDASSAAVPITDNSGSLTVDNGGTFAVQATVAAGAINIAKAEDAASADNDVGVPAMAVRRATPANTSGADGDYEFLQVSDGRLWVDASGKTLTVDGSGATQPVSDGGGSLTVDNGGTFAVQATVTAGATNIAKAEDAPSADNDVGVPSLAVRKSTPANTSGTDGDYEFLQMSDGRLWVDASGKTLTVDGSGATQPVSNAGTFAVQATMAAGAITPAKAEDAPSADADVGIPAMAVRKASPANTSGTDGDYEMLQMSAGRLWASTNIDQINGVAPSMGNGASGTGVQRVTIANDSTGQITLAAGTNLVGRTAASLETSTLYNATTALTPKFAKIAISSSGANTIVAAVTSKKLRVLAYNIMANGAVNTKWQSHVTPTDLTGLKYFDAAGAGISVGFNPVGWFETVSGEALDLNLSGAVAVGGELVYVEV